MTTLRACLPALVFAACGRADESSVVPEWTFHQEAEIRAGADPEGFNTIKGLLLTRGGNVWVLEASTYSIHILDSTGQLIRKFGRKGQGPGEFLWPDGMAMAPDGMIWVHDGQNARFSVFADSGQFLRQQIVLVAGWGWTWNGGIDRSGMVWDEVFGSWSDPRKRLRRSAPGGSPADTFEVPTHRSITSSEQDGYYSKPIDKTGAPKYTIEIPFYPFQVEIFDWNSAAVWYAPSGAEYRITKLSLTRHDTLARLTRQATPVPVSSAERDTAIAEIRRDLASMNERDPDWSRIPTMKPLIVGGFVDDSERLWVRRSSAAEDTPYDVYAPDGSPLATVRIPHRVVWWVRPAIRGNLIWLVASNEDGIPYVVRGRVGR